MNNKSEPNLIVFFFAKLLFNKYIILYTNYSYDIYRANPSDNGYLTNAMLQSIEFTAVWFKLRNISKSHYIIQYITRCNIINNTITRRK